MAKAHFFPFRRCLQRKVKRSIAAGYTAWVAVSPALVVRQALPLGVTEWPFSPFRPFCPLVRFAFYYLPSGKQFLPFNCCRMFVRLSCYIALFQKSAQKRVCRVRLSALHLLTSCVGPRNILRSVRALPFAACRSARGCNSSLRSGKLHPLPCRA